MKIDYFSDPHFDFYFPLKKNPNEQQIYTFYEQFIVKNEREVGEILIIAGDLGHYNLQNIQILKVLKQFYKHIVCVLGNHDYYLIGEKARNAFHENSFERVKAMRALINAEAGVHCLDGNVIEIEGIKFGGCDGWYNDAYSRTYHPGKEITRESNNYMWFNSMNDGRLIYGIQNFDDIYEIELPKMQAVYKECDIMITHTNPSHLKVHTARRFRNQITNIFFSFDGLELMKEGSMKYWIFGHTHNPIQYEVEGVQCLCNPIGYPNENLHFQVKSFNIEAKEKRLHNRDVSFDDKDIMDT